MTRNTLIEKEAFMEQDELQRLIHAYVSLHDLEARMAFLLMMEAHALNSTS